MATKGTFMDCQDIKILDLFLDFDGNCKILMVMKWKWFSIKKVFCLLLQCRKIYFIDIEKFCGGNYGTFSREMLIFNLKVLMDFLECFLLEIFKLNFT